MTRTKISIEVVNRLLQLYDSNANMNVNDQQKRSNLSSILTKIGFYGQRNNVNAVEQAINAVVSRNIYMEQSKAATVIQNHEQEQLQKQRELDIKELREEFDPELLDEDGIFDPERYRQQQHQLRALEIEERRRKQDEDRQARQAQLLDEFHNVEDMNIDILFETDQQEISDYIRTHDKYMYRHLNTDNDIIMLCDVQNQDQFNRIKNLALNRYNIETDKHLDSILDKEKGYVFKLAVDFGVLIERVDGNNEDQTIKYKYVLPVDASSERRAPLEIQSRDNISMYKQYLRTVVGSMQERTNTDTHEKIVSIFSIMLFVFRYPLAGAAIPSLRQHIKRREIYYVDCKVNLCFWTAYSFITMPNSKDKRKKDCSRISEAKRIFQSVKGVEFRDNYQGFNFVGDIDNFIKKNRLMCTYKQFNILFINDGINAHIMYISDVEALTGFRYCNICHKQAFRISDKNLQQSMRKHMEKCQMNDGKIVKKVIIEKFAKPFVPHILSIQTYKYLLANNLTHLFKPTRYYITYDIETLEKKVNEKYSDSSQVNATLIPYAIASTVKLASDKWLEQLFEEAKQVKKDNKYIDETIPQYYEVPVIGFNSAKFDASVLFKNLKQNDWTISKYLGSSTIAKQIVVKHKFSSIHLRFVDFKIYQMQHKLKDAVEDFGNGTYKKDTRVLIEPIDYLIELMFKYKVDMLANISMSQCANAIKYSMAYNGFDINGDYNCESTDKSIEITQNYWRAKVDSYIEQDNKKKRNSSNNITIDDYDYFKELFKNQRCHMYNARFTWKNRPTLDRIDNCKGHSKDNVLPCCLYCNICKANRDENQMKLMIHLRKYALLKQLPMTLTSDEGYQLLRKGITGDFHSQYPSVMSGEPNALKPYTNHIIYMPAQLIERITDQDRCKALIYDTNRFSNDPLVVDKMLLFVAEIKGHTDEKYINEVINWGSILRNIDITTNRQTIGEFMYNHLVELQLPHDKTERKLTNLIDTNNEVMSFNNYYVWLLIDTCHLVIDEIVSVTTFTKHANFNSFIKEFMNLRQQAKDAKNEGLGQFCKLILNSAFG
ncbi:MAG: hypothetical protein EZS28_004435 [Streblomastix strix]|uniref:Uncharacterized protein n=1 Tax=Streblomastix strix TaxID=222440 RepID=A0A5J4WY70_9EUKA|nr:MAG: hypothetical protein EZS28_004435 [Streblomastix strix]